MSSSLPLLSASHSSASDLSSTSSRRRWRSNHSNQSPALPKDVCNWRLKHSDLLNIKYANDFLPTPLSVLEKIGHIAEITPLQKKYLYIVKFYIQVEQFDFLVNDRPFPWGCLDENEYQSIIDGMMNKLECEDKTSLWSKLYGTDETTIIQPHDIQIEWWVNLKVREFLFVLMKMIEAIVRKRRLLIPIPEITFCELTQAFADLCQLKAWNGKENPARIRDLLGVKQITSEPDLRLYSTGMSVIKLAYPTKVASVIEIKGDQEMACIEKSEVPTKRRRISSGSSDTDVQFPAIGKKFGSNVLGQHAGELFLDCIDSLILSEDGDVGYMPGMIIDGTKIHFTLLEITASHFQKLQKCTQRAKLDLDETDKATIYYSEPLDILRRNDRDILLDSFMSLNNIIKKSTII